MSEFDNNEVREAKAPDEVISKYFDVPTDSEPKSKAKKSHFYRNLIIGVIVLALCLGSVSFGLSASGAAGRLLPKTNAVSTEATTETDEEEFGGFYSQGSEAEPMALVADSIYEASQNRVKIIKQVKPSVVAISTVAYSQDWFFGSYEVEGSGSGFVFGKDAYNVYIATNNHVISGATDITVSFNENTPIAGKVVGVDQNADLAVVAVTTADLQAAGITEVTVAAFGDSALMQPGDPVIAIGNALGEGITATSGIVSVISKQINVQGKTLTVIQTDTAINEGNSGGPLFNDRGEVIGINTAKFSSETIEGMGFSIASNVAAPIFEKLATGQSAPTLGVTVQTVPAEYAETLGTAAGAYVVEVTEGGNADLAGIQAGDVITTFNGEAVFNSTQLVEYVRNCSANDVVEISGLRGGVPFNIKVTLYPPAIS